MKHLEKFSNFKVNENYNQDLLDEIEQKFIILDDMDIRYNIEKLIYPVDKFNTYKFGYKINIESNITTEEIEKLTKHFKKFYKVEIKNSLKKYPTIQIYEEKTLSKNDILDLYFNDKLTKLSIIDFNEYIFRNIKKENNVSNIFKKEKKWYIGKKLIFVKKDHVLFFDRELYYDEMIKNIESNEFDENKEDIVRIIVKAFFEEHVNYNIGIPSASNLS
jgi:hypothetical protein